MSAALDERRSQAVPVVTLLAVAGACWAVTVQRMRGMDMGPGTDLGGLGWFAVVWVTMMAAMMLPSFAPMGAAYVRSAGRGPLRALPGSLVFAAGYLLVWAAFGVVAYALFHGVRSLGIHVLAWDHAGRYVAGGVIVAAALYELSSMKRRCLRHCRDASLLRRRRGAAGVVTMGIEQGAFCVGCSGALMAALFALGVMSIVWMLVVSALVAVEKLLPWRLVTTGAAAALLLVLGVAVMAAPDHVPWLTVPMSMAS